MDELSILLLRRDSRRKLDAAWLSGILVRTRCRQSAVARNSVRTNKIIGRLVPMEGSVNLSTVAIAIACLALLVAIVALHQARERTGSPPVREPYKTINREYKSTLKLFVS